jgi:hypothetical protein
MRRRYRRIYRIVLPTDYFWVGKQLVPFEEMDWDNTPRLFGKIRSMRYGKKAWGIFRSCPKGTVLNVATYDRGWKYTEWEKR